MASKSSTPLRVHQSPEHESEPVNSFEGLGKSMVRETGNAFQQIGSDIFNSILGLGESKDNNRPDFAKDFSKEQMEQFEAWQNGESKPQPVRRERTTLFSYREKQESQQIKEIKELLKQIKQEIQAIKRQESQFSQQIADAEKLTLETDPKAGIYHIRFLEIILKLLHSIRQKMGESNSWLSVMQSKKPKRGSAFAKNSKEKGTAYSMSQEHSITRQTQ